MLKVELETTGVYIEVSPCPNNRSWSCPQDTVNAQNEERGIPAYCSIKDCPGRAGFVQYEYWRAAIGDIEPVFIEDTLLWIRKEYEPSK